MSPVLLALLDQKFSRSLVEILRGEGFDVMLLPAWLGTGDLSQGRDARLVLVEDTTTGWPDLGPVRGLRAMSSVPIIVLTRDASEDTSVEFLNAGADFVLVQPISVRELIARIHTLLRRFELPPPGDEYIVRSGSVTLHTDRHTATVDGRPLQLTVREFQLLEVLVRNAGFVISREELLNSVWGPTSLSARAVTTCIRRLRSKLEVDPRRPQHIQTVRGIGYRFSDSTSVRRP